MIGSERAPCDEGLLRATAPDTRGCLARTQPWVLATAILGSSMAFIDGSVVNVALPVLQAEWGASVRTVQWIVNAYTLLLGALILVGGSAGDRFGRREIFAWGVVLFAAASVACGAAQSAMALIAARAAQGIGAALLVPNSLALISTAYAKHERGAAIGTWAGFSALTTALGPVLGGWLVDAWSWRAIFFLNVPIALAALALVRWRVPPLGGRAGEATIDWRGGVLASAGLAALAWGLTSASARGWADPVVAGTVLAGALVLAAFVRWERRAASPMMPLDLFRSRTFSGANAMTLLLYFALSGVLFFLPFNLIEVQGYSATAAGAAFLPFTLILGALSRWAGSLSERVGARKPLVAGPVVAGIGIAGFALPDIGGSYWTTFFPAMVVLGVGMAISVAPLTATVMAAVDDRQAGTASGINNAVSRVAGVLAVALLGAIAVSAFGASLDARLARLQVAPETRQALRAEVPRLAEAAVPDRMHARDRQVLEAAIDEAFVRSFRVVMLLCAALALLGALCAARTIREDAVPVAGRAGSIGSRSG